MRIDGRIQMDAALMDADLEAGGVAAIEEVKNPIRVARDVFGTPHVLLVGSDATAFAQAPDRHQFALVTAHRVGGESGSLSV